MKYFRLNFYFFIVLLFLVSCNKEEAPDFLKTTGEIVFEERELIDFKINLTLIQDTFNKVKIEAGKNLIPEIVTEVKEGKLTIKNTNKFNFLRSYKKEINVTLWCKNIKQLTYRGAGNIKTQNQLTSSPFTFDSHKGTGIVELNCIAQETHFNIHTGHCELILHGNIGVNYLYQAGNGYTNAEDLITGYTFVTNKGTNDLKINVYKVLYAQINYLGNIYYKGDAYEVASDITDDGKLIKID
jgi:hypothetical protein